MRFIEVILPLSVPGTFTYEVPGHFVDSIRSGMRVLVPFRGKKMYTAIISGIQQERNFDFKPKEIVSVLDAQPIIPPEQLKFWHWLADYYLFYPGDIYRYAVPGSLKLESETFVKISQTLPESLPDLDDTEQILFDALQIRQTLNLKEIENFLPRKFIIPTIDQLIAKRLIELQEQVREKFRAKEIKHIRLKDEFKDPEQTQRALQSLHRAKKQREILLAVWQHYLDNSGTDLKKSELLSTTGAGTAQLSELMEKGILEEYVREEDRLRLYQGEITDTEELSEAQQKALENILNAFHQHKPVLLHGVTGSGKTHVYLELADLALAEGGNVLMLVPEIALNKQIIQRIEKNYGDILGFYHQKLTDFERVEIWKKVKSGQLKFIIATRPGLFLPFEDLDLVIIDEEHDQQYRPDHFSPAFHARDAALMLAKLYGAKCILGTATPSVEIWLAAKEHKIHLEKLEQRFSGIPLPQIEVQNFKEALESKTHLQSYSLKSVGEIQEELQQEHQVMVLHNRRGYASVVECENCGYVTYCSNCDVVMTYHKSDNEMKCHYCGQKAAKFTQCPKCTSDRISIRGVGIEQLEEETQSVFPGKITLRMDTDSMRKKYAYEDALSKIHKKEADIILGTQMLTKGLDFENFYYGIIPRADALLHVQDFRIEERAYQLITQFSGRIGRSGKQGKLTIQTYHPEHPVFNFLTKQNAEELYDYFLEERQKFAYPPYYRMIRVILKHRKQDKLGRASEYFTNLLKQRLSEEWVIGPVAPGVSRINLLYLMQTIIKIPREVSPSKAKAALRQVALDFREIDAYQSVQLSMVVDF